MTGEQGVAVCFISCKGQGLSVPLRSEEVGGHVPHGHRRAGRTSALSLGVWKKGVMTSPRRPLGTSRGWCPKGVSTVAVARGP